ncbi:hypothetical protein C8R48DRAFT_708619 [Suillus tomentosus]|nr:hypothetical protein C8R48DRAFT_708619 [Suillus tomentosus]
MLGSMSPTVVAGGSVLIDVLRTRQQVKIRLGIVTKDTWGRNHARPLSAGSLHAENKQQF